MTIRNKIIRLIEQPSIPIEVIKGIIPSLSKGCITSRSFMEEDFNMVLDVGSNAGEFAKAAKFNFPEATILTFEPLRKHLSDFNFGLWNKNTKKEFYINDNRDVESSFLEPETFEGRKEEIELKRFDCLDIKIQKPCFLKIDVEGAEDKVLEGFGDILKEIDIIQVETTHKPFFKGQAKLWKIMKILDKYNFKGFKQVNMTFTDGKADKSDLIFFK